MSLRSTLDTIDRVLAECDARHLPPLSSAEAASVLDWLQHHDFQLTNWQRDIVKSTWAGPASRRRAVTVVVDELPPGPTTPRRSWLDYLLRRNR